MDYKYGDRQKELNTNNCRLFAIASWTLLCSFLQFRSGKPTIYFNVEVLFPVLFAALNTVTEILYHRQYAKIYFKESDENGLKKYLLFRGMVFFLFYFAIYNTVFSPFPTADGLWTDALLFRLCFPDNVHRNLTYMAFRR